MKYFTYHRIRWLCSILLYGYASLYCNAQQIDISISEQTEESKKLFYTDTLDTKDDSVHVSETFSISSEDSTDENSSLRWGDENEEDEIDFNAEHHERKAPVFFDTVVRWLTIEQATAYQKLQPRKMYIQVYATWCKWCKAMDTLYKHPAIAHYLNTHFYPVRFNAESKETVRYKDQLFSFKDSDTEWVHELTLYLLKDKQAYPGHVFTDERGNHLDVRTGYFDIILLENILNYYGSNAYEEMTFEYFEHDFKGYTH